MIQKPLEDPALGCSDIPLDETPRSIGAALSFGRSASKFAARSPYAARRRERNSTQVR
jgi:hypothetical protein